MQNKPNLHTSSHKCLRNIDLQKTLHPKYAIRNTTYAIRDYLCKTNPISHKKYITKCLCFSSTLHRFYSFSRQRCGLFLIFLNFHTQKNLTPYISKVYKNIHPSIRFALHERRKYAKQTQFTDTQ